MVKNNPMENVKGGLVPESQYKEEQEEDQEDNDD